MILKAEASIDLDPNRKIWITLSGKTEPDEDPAEVIPVLAESLVSAAVSAHEQASVSIGMTPAGPDLRTFGDD